MRTGCNTIHPTERLRNSSVQFGREMQIESIRLLKEAGFDAVEFSHIEHLSDSDLAAIANATREMGVIPWSAHSWQAIPGDQSGVSRALDVYRDFIHKSRILGVEVVVVHCQGTRELLDQEQRDSRLSANLACLELLAEMAADADIRVAIENGTSWSEWLFIIDMVKGLNHPNVGLNIDTGHANLGDMDPVKSIFAAKGLLITTHLQDNNGNADDHLPPGLGQIDWQGVVQALSDVDYGGVYMVEISDCPPNREPDAPNDIRVAHDNLTRFLSQLEREVDRC